MQRTVNDWLRLSVERAAGLAQPPTNVYRLDRDRTHLVRAMVWCLREWRQHEGVWA